MTVVRSLDCAGTVPMQSQPEEGRVVQLCKKDKERFQKIQTVAGLSFLLLSPILLSGKLIFESVKALNDKVFSIQTSNTSPIASAVSSLFKVIYSIPAFGILLVTSPLFFAFSSLRKTLLEEFDYLHKGLEKAAEVGDVKALEIIFETNQIDHDKLLSALSRASASGQSEAFKFLLKQADISQLDSRVLADFLNQAIANGHFGFVKPFIDAVGVSSYCHQAMDRVLKAGELEAAYSLSQTDEHYLSSQQGAVLVLAAKKGDLEKVISLVSSAKALPSAGAALMSAVKHGHVEIVKYLVQLDNKYVFKSISLQKAAEIGHLPIAKEILNSGEIEQIGKKRAYELAMKNGFFEIANEIKKH